MDKRATMDETELKAIIASEIRQSLGYLGSGVSEERADNWDRYFAKPYGNEREGYSQVVSTDAMDTVEWIMPSLMRVFCSGEEIVRYEPVGPEDEEVAKQATDYINHIFTKDNPGVLIIHSWFKDALIAKNGFVKWYWDESEDWRRESYRGLTDDAFALLLQDEEIEPVEHSETVTEAMDPMTGAPMPVTLHDIVIRRKRTKGKACIVNVPPEEFLIDKNAKDIESARFVGHRRRYTVSELREEGVPEDILDRLPKGDEDYLTSEEALSRMTDAEDISNLNAADPDNPAMREVWVTEAYIRVDYDGDGIAELRKVRVAGPSSEIISNDAWEGMVPFADLTPIPIPHKFIGLSVVDLIRDLQLIKTTVLRQYLDGLYIANNPRMEVKQDQIVDPGEVTDSKAGGIVRTTGMGPALMPIQTAFVGPAALQGLEYIDTLRENRTGVTRYNQGIDANSLNKTATGVNQIMTAAQQRLELIARVFAETGVKRLFKGLLELVCRYQDKAKMIRLRNTWVPMDPRSWNTEFDMTVTVGLGNGNRDMMAAQMMQLLGLQFQAVQFQGGIEGPFVRGENLYNSVEKLVQYMGLKTAEPYFTDPASQPPPPPRPDPEMAKAQAQMQLEQQKAQMSLAQKREEAMINAEIERQKAQNSVQLETMQARADIEVDRQKAAAQMEIERMKMQAKLEIETFMAQMKAQQEMVKAAMEHKRESERVAGENARADFAAKSSSDVSGQIGKAIESMTKAVEALSRPKRVVRDEAGRVAGVE